MRGGGDKASGGTGGCTHGSSESRSVTAWCHPGPCTASQHPCFRTQVQTPRRRQQLARRTPRQQRQTAGILPSPHTHRLLSQRAITQSTFRCTSCVRQHLVFGVTRRHGRQCVENGSVRGAVRCGVAQAEDCGSHAIHKWRHLERAHRLAPSLCRNGQMPIIFSMRAVCRVKE